MKNICLGLLLFCACSMPVVAQTTTEVAPETYKNEIGIDLTMLVSSLFGWNQGWYVYDYYPYNYYSSANSYLFSYKRHFGDAALRVGFGADMTNSTSDDDAETFENTYNMMRTDVRVGYEFDIHPGKRVDVYFGADVVFHNNSYETKIETDDVISADYTTTSGTVSVGGGPLMGVSWYAFKRLKLSTEASLHYLSSNTSYEVKYTDTPENNTNSNTSTSEIRMNYPMFINLEFLF